MEILKILFVDDEIENLQTIIKRMQKRALDVTGVAGAAEALAVLASQPIDVVVMDARMPGMDSIDALREIKSRHPLIEVIMLTGHASMEVAIQGMELGAFDYLMKPIAIDELLYKIQDAFQKRHIHLQKIKGKQDPGR